MLHLNKIRVGELTSFVFAFVGNNRIESRLNFQLALEGIQEANPYAETWAVVDFAYTWILNGADV